MTTYPPKITFGEMRASGVRDVLFIAAHRCSHSVEISVDRWPDRRSEREEMLAEQEVQSDGFQARGKGAVPKGDGRAQHGLEPRIRRANRVAERQEAGSHSATPPSKLPCYRGKVK
jgi:hypothetical protein